MTSRGSGLLGRFSAGLSSQALSMFTNSVVVIGLARSMSLSDFGRLALVYGVAQFLIGLVRASSVEVYASRYAGSKEGDPEVSSLLLTTLARLGAAQVLCLAVSLFLSNGQTLLYVVLAVVVLPGGLTETWRHLAFAKMRPVVAFYLDCTWLVAGAAAASAALVLSVDVAVALVVGWVVGALAAAVSGWIHFGRPAPSRATKAWQDLKSENSWAYCLEFLVSRGTPEATAWLLVAFGTVADAGSFRLAQTVLGPLSVLFASMRGLLVAELRRVEVSGGDVLKSAMFASPLLFAVAPIYAGFLFLFPSSLGESILGSGWIPAVSFAGYLAFRRAFSMASIPPFLILRIWQKGKITSLVRLAEAAVAISLVATGGWLFGTTGALGGLVVSSVLAAAAWWYFLMRHKHASTEIPEFGNVKSPDVESKSGSA